MKTKKLAYGAALAVVLLAVASWGAWNWKFSALAQHKELVRYMLKDPDSAQFRSVFQSPRDAETWCGEMNARNSLGGLSGFKRYVFSAPKDVDPSTDRGLFLALARFLEEGNSGFDGRWKAFCE